MKNFNRGGGNFGHRDSNRGSMHKAICADCGQSCEVPFKPTGDKPVYCSNCFKGKDTGRDSNRFERRDSGRPSFGEKKMFRATCDKCGQSCEVPFQPSAGKPVYCSNCFSKGDNAGGNNAVSEQIKSLNDKLDKILRLLTPATASQPIVKKEEVREVKKAAPKKAAKKAPVVKAKPAKAKKAKKK